MLRNFAFRLASQLTVRVFVWHISIALAPSSQVSLSLIYRLSASLARSDISIALAPSSQIFGDVQRRQGYAL
jgi:hypothetical protein